MTPEQRALARHALGLPNWPSLSLRNRYAIYRGAPGYADWCAMVAAGWAFQGPEYKGDRLLFFHLTRAGAELAIDKGEELDLEDFKERRTE